MRSCCCTVLLCLVVSVIADNLPDVIVVGSGTAGTYFLRQLVPKYPNLRFVVIDAGDFLSSHVGASQPRTSAFNASVTDLTSIDIPGQYNNLAYVKSIDAAYQLPEATWGFLGRGIGGNANFNGALMQIPDDSYFDSWPTGWQAADLATYYSSVFSACNVTDTPSADRQHYANASFHILAATAASLGSKQTESVHMPPVGVLQHGYPNVGVVKGERCYVTKQLEELFTSNGTSRFSNLELIKNSKVTRMLLDTTSASGIRALGVEYVTLDNGFPHTILLSQAQNSPRKIILAAGAVITPTILYRSGVGPSSLKDFVFPGGSNFTVDNEGVGVRLSDHNGAAIVVECSQYDAYQSFQYAPHDVEAYLTNRTGPFAQYAPVFYMYNGSSRVELFVNPWGLGTIAQDPQPSPWNNQHTFSINAVLFDPMPRSYVMWNTTTSTVAYPDVYNNAEDVANVANALHLFLTQLLKNFGEANPSSNCSVSFGPGAPPFEQMSPFSATDMFNYVNAWGPYPYEGDVWWSHLVMNHFVGTVPISEGGQFGADPSTLKVGGLANVHAVDASIIPGPVWAHPVATILAVAAKAADLISAEFEASQSLR